MSSIPKIIPGWGSSKSFSSILPPPFAEESSRSPSHCISPPNRSLPADISTPSFEDLADLAVLRIFDAAFPLENRPPRIFPTAETVFAKYFSYDDWLLHGDLETELGRMSHMLLSFPERGIPSRCLSTIRLVLSASPMLDRWQLALPRLKNEAAAETQSIIHQMQGLRRPKDGDHNKSDFITIPVDYDIDTTASTLGFELWQTSLSEIVDQIAKGQFKQAEAFMQIFSFLKDPLGGIRGVSKRAVDLFAYLLASFAGLARSATVSPTKYLEWYSAVAQAAQEAIFLSDPLLETVEYIHFYGHQQLTYVYVAMDKLPRSEFSLPDHVLQIIEEILTSTSRGQRDCPIAPIAVSSYSGLSPSESGPISVIIDGNHRTTATMMLRLIAEHSTVVLGKSPQDALDVFCKNHKLDLRWKVDLKDVVEALLENPYYQLLVNRKMDIINLFRHVDAIPALVVREDNFHTACQQRGARENRPRLLLPIHQAIYNDESLGFAFPQAGQVHGRALGFKAMPLIRQQISSGS